MLLSFRRRTPHGVRGLKYDDMYARTAGRESHPAWGAWIEIALEAGHAVNAVESHPAWGAWIEMIETSFVNGLVNVAPRMGCVD